MRGPFHFFMFSSGPKFFRPISPFVFHIQFLQGDHFLGVISREGSTKISSASLQRSSPIIVTTPTLSALSSPAHASRRATRRRRRGRRRGHASAILGVHPNAECVELACAVAMHRPSSVSVRARGRRSQWDNAVAHTDTEFGELSPRACRPGQCFPLCPASSRATTP